MKRNQEFSFNSVGKLFKRRLSLFCSVKSSSVYPGLHFSEFLCISLNSSAFLYTSLEFSTFLCISLNFSVFIWISLHFSAFIWISLHFSAFYISYFRTPFFNLRCVYFRKHTFKWHNILRCPHWTIHLIVMSLSFVGVSGRSRKSNEFQSKDKSLWREIRLLHDDEKSFVTKFPNLVAKSWQRFNALQSSNPPALHAFISTWDSQSGVLSILLMRRLRLE